VGSNTVFFDFTYDSTAQSFGYKDENGDFIPFSSGGTDVSDTTATADKVLSGYYFYNSNGEKTEGTFNGIDTSDATATAKRIEAGYTAYVKGVKITGSAYIEHSFGKYEGTIQSLSQAACYSGAGTSTTNNAIIACNRGTYDINCYSTTLSISIISNSNRYMLGNGNTINGNALYPDSSGYYKYMCIINPNLTLSTIARDGKNLYCPCHNSNYALYFRNDDNGNIACYDKSLTYSLAPSGLSVYEYISPGGSFNDNALFTCSKYYGGYYHIESYNNQCTRSIYPNFTLYGSDNSGWSSSNTHSINGVGNVSGGNVYGGNAQVLDTNFTMSTVALSGALRAMGNGGNMDDHCMLIDINSGTYRNEYTGIYNVFDNSLTCTQGTLVNKYNEKAVAHVGIYNLLAGGQYYPYSGADYSYSTTVEAFYES
jgi:hypothetical protein